MWSQPIQRILSTLFALALGVAWVFGIREDGGDDLGGFARSAMNQWALSLFFLAAIVFWLWEFWPVYSPRLGIITDRALKRRFRDWLDGRQWAVVTLRRRSEDYAFEIVAQQVVIDPAGELAWRGGTILRKPRGQQTIEVSLTSASLDEEAALVAAASEDRRLAILERIRVAISQSGGVDSSLIIEGIAPGDQRKPALRIELAAVMSIDHRTLTEQHLFDHISRVYNAHEVAFATIAGQLRELHRETRQQQGVALEALPEDDLTIPKTLEIRVPQELGSLDRVRVFTELYVEGVRVLKHEMAVVDQAARSFAATIPPEEHSVVETNAVVEALYIADVSGQRAILRQQRFVATRSDQSSADAE